MHYRRDSPTERLLQPELRCSNEKSGHQQSGFYAVQVSGFEGFHVEERVDDGDRCRPDVPFARRDGELIEEFYDRLVRPRAALPLVRQRPLHYADSTKVARIVR